MTRPNSYRLILGGTQRTSSAHGHHCTSLRTLIETFGNEAAGDMVAWMQGVDDHRAQLRELHDLGAARIDARFEQMDARIDARFAQMDARMDARFDQMDAKIAAVETRLDARIDQLEMRLDARIDQVEMRLGGRIDQVSARIDITANELKSKIDQRFGDLIKWSFLFWCGAVATAALWRR